MPQHAFFHTSNLIINILKFLIDIDKNYYSLFGTILIRIVFIEVGLRLQKKFPIYIIIIISLILSIVIFVGNNQKNPEIVIKTNSNLSVKADPPILISGDGGFVTFPGFGNKTHPYLIEDFIISASGTHCIWIENTTAYFIVRNCTLATPLWYRSGIYLWNVTNGLLENNTVRDTGEGISIRYSDDITICYNNMSDNVYDIDLRYSHNNTIYNNTSYNTPSAILLINSNDTRIFNNTINLSNTGISLDNSKNNTVSENRITQTISAGIDLFYSFNNTLVNNTMSHGDYGFILGRAKNNTILNNTIKFNIWTGVSVRYSSNNNHIAQNTIRHNKLGINIWDSNQNWIIGNTISNSSWEGIRCGDHSLSNHILNNHISMSDLGINIQEFSNNNFIIGNHIQDCNRCIAEFQCWGNTIRDNTCQNITGQEIPGFEWPFMIIGLGMIFLLSKLLKGKKTFNHSNFSLFSRRTSPL